MQHLSKPAVLPRRQRCRCVDGEPKPASTAQGFVAGSRKTVRIGLGGAADFSYLQWYNAANGPIAQLDRVTDFYSVGCRFESCWDRQSQQFQMLTGRQGRLLCDLPPAFRFALRATAVLRRSRRRATSLIAARRLSYRLLRPPYHRSGAGRLATAGAAGTNAIHRRPD
jgi:hypothetical protein